MKPVHYCNIYIIYNILIYHTLIYMLQINSKYFHYITERTSKYQILLQ